MPTVWERTQSLLSRGAEAKNLAALMKEGIGGTLLGISSVLIGTILAIGDVAIEPISALAGALADLTVAIFGSPAQIIIAGAESTAASLIGPFNVGPLTFALGIGSVLAGLFIVGRYRDEEETGNLIPGLPFDVPFIGEEEEGDG